jgi:hypothetical protein
VLDKDASDSDESSDVPQWFVDWFYVLYTEQRAVWQVRATVCPLAPPVAVTSRYVPASSLHARRARQMLAVAQLTPLTGAKHAEGLFRACMSYLTLFWQARLPSPFHPLRATIALTNMARSSISPLAPRPPGGRRTRT